MERATGAEGYGKKDCEEKTGEVMASIQSLHILRHLARRAHQDAVSRKQDDADVYATAHEELCELLGKTDLVLTLCHLFENHPSDAAHVRETCVIGSVIGVSHPVVLNFKASQS